MKFSGQRSAVSGQCRLRVPALIAFVASSVICGALLGGAFNFTFAQTDTRHPKPDTLSLFVRAWNDMGASMTRENPLLEELQTNLQLNPPGRVLDARALDRRRVLYELVVTEHARQLNDLKKLQEEDR